jgi:hypothetical protein
VSTARASRGKIDPMATSPWFSAPEGRRIPHAEPVPDAEPSPDAAPGSEVAPLSAPGATTAALVAFAAARLADGRRPEQAFSEVVALGTDRRLAAIAVCVAAGTAWDVAEARMASFDDIWASLSGGSAETAGGLLELYGYFDLEVELDDHQAAVAGHLREAMAAAEYLPSGYANQMYRLLRTARLREALFSLEEMGAARWPDNLAFWREMAEAAVRLDSAAILDTELAAVRHRCESRARP